METQNPTGTPSVPLPTAKTGIISPAQILEKGIVRAADGYPEIVVEGVHNQLQQVGIDLRLAKVYRVAGRGALRLEKRDTVVPELLPMVAHDGIFGFDPDYQYALDFMEDVAVPEDMAALVIHRSTINRTLGTVLSGMYDPGFRSVGGCGAIFRPSSYVTIEVGYRMAQIVFFSAESASLYNGQYQGGRNKPK